MPRLVFFFFTQLNFAMVQTNSFGWWVKVVRNFNCLPPPYPTFFSNTRKFYIEVGLYVIHCNAFSPFCQFFNGVKSKEQGYILRYSTFTHTITKLNIVEERRRIVLTTMIKVRKGDMPVFFLQIMFKLSRPHL